MDAATTPRLETPARTAGALIREWRAARRLSQLDLASRAGFSARHVSFIETGRTQPSRQALLILAETLDVPLRERNQLLQAGGFAHIYPQTAFAAENLQHLRGVLQFVLDRHEPYAALVLDRYSNCLMGNVASRRLMAALVDPALLSDHMNHLRLVFHPRGARRWIVNWREVSRRLLSRAERELGSQRGDDEAQRLLADLRGYAREPDVARSVPPSPADVLLPVHLVKGDVDCKIFSTIMTLGTPWDVTLQDIRLEAFFPADPASEAAWPRLLANDEEERGLIRRRDRY
jgi:transcriptional regulator with XRE-family HTH domain